MSASVILQRPARAYAPPSSRPPPAGLAALRAGDARHGAAGLWLHSAPTTTGFGDGMVEVAARPATGTEDALAGVIAAVAGGDRTAFEKLYRATSSKLFGVCLRVLPDRAEAEDVLQEVYATVWRKAAQFDASRASSITWLAMIARNKAIDRLRATPAAARTAPIEVADAVADPGPSPLHVTEAAVESQRLGACMDQLDSRRRSLIRTAFFEGATYEELAERIGSPLGSVKSWIRRGLIQLRACLELSA